MVPSSSGVCIPVKYNMTEHSIANVAQLVSVECSGVFYAGQGVARESSCYPRCVTQISLYQK
jgi:hypothetical protein